MGTLRFDAFTLELGSEPVLKRNGSEVPLRRQPRMVLAYLAQRPGQIVTNAELIEGCWDNPKQTSVNSLAQCMTEIRAALGETRQPVIRTVPRRGYVFAAPVGASTAADAPPAAASSPYVVAAAGLAAPASRIVSTATRALGRLGALGGRRRWQAAAAALAPIAVLVAGGWVLWPRTEGPAAPVMMATPSIAVLPFKAVGDERDEGDAASALAGDIETYLSQAHRGYSLRIVHASRSTLSGDHPKAGGRALGVRYLVLGTSRLEGGTRHANVQLIEAESGHQVWAKPLSHRPGEVGAQGLAAAQIARLINVEVLRAEARLPLPAHPEAGHFVILGRALMEAGHGESGTRRAKAFYDKALALDPRSVAALNGYARIRVNEVLNGWAPKEARKTLLDEAGDAIERAIDIDPKVVGTHFLRGSWLRAWARYDEAIVVFERVVGLQDDFPIAHAELGRTQIEVGKADAALPHIRKALQLSPTDPYRNAWYFWAGMAEAHVAADTGDLQRYRSALGWLLKAREENLAFKNVLPWLAIAHAGRGEWERARAYMEEILGHWPRFSIASWHAALPSRHPIVERQRSRLAALLCEAGAPGCDVATTAAQ